MAPIKGPALFIARFVQNTPFSDILNTITVRVRDLHAVDDQIIFKPIFFKIEQNSFTSCIILESKCDIERFIQDAHESFEFIYNTLIHTFNTFVDVVQDDVTNRKIPDIQG